MNPINIRKAVFFSLLSCAENDRYVNLEANSFISSNVLTERDRLLYTAMLYGTTEKKITLDHQIRKLSKNNFDSIEPKTLVLLRLGLYQILFMGGIPDRAAVNETVALANELTHKGASGFINAILRRACKELKNEKGELTLLLPDKERDICGHLSIKYAFPRYLCKKWISAYGEDTAVKIMISLNKQPLTTLRINTLKISRDDYSAILTENGISHRLSENTTDGIILNGASISSLPGYEKGLFFVQDDSSRLCVQALSPKENETVIDCCACPGGKSFAAAIKMNNKGKIFSCDIHDNKLSLVTSGASRLGIDIIETYCCDASTFNEKFKNAADKVLCDVPCSGFGTISKKPDLRLKPKESADSLPALQLSILTNCSGYVKPGGTLVYSTCTLNPDENENNVLAFLTLNPDFEIQEERTFFPFESEYDGFYYAKLRKKLNLN